MKKIVAIILSLVTIISMVGCVSRVEKENSHIDEETGLAHWGQ